MRIKRLDNNGCLSKNFRTKNTKKRSGRKSPREEVEDMYSLDVSNTKVYYKQYYILGNI